LPEDEALEEALISLGTLVIVRIDESWGKRSLWAGLYTIIRVSIELCDRVPHFRLERSVIAIADGDKALPQCQDLLNPDRPKDTLYIVQGDVWDRVPKHLRGMIDLSRPHPDTVFSIYPCNPEALRLHETQGTSMDSKAGDAVEDAEETCHPLSNVAMYRILADPATKERAPVKSTSVHPNFVMAHDLMVLEVEIGSIPWPAVDEDRSPEMQMQDARARACNAMYFQLGTIAQLRMDVPLPTDKDNEGRLDRFVLAMTVCGEIWTVEYAYRARVDDPTVSICYIHEPS
jgi:hypothetical protein